MTAYDPAPWHDLCVALAGASGALLGLAFVAISFNLDAIIADKFLPARAVETLIFFAYPLAGSLLVLTPGLSHTTLGIGLAMLAAGLLALVFRVDRPRWQHERDDPLAWRVSHAIPATCSPPSLSSLPWRRSPSASVVSTGWAGLWPWPRAPGSSTAGFSSSRSSAEPRHYQAASRRDFCSPAPSDGHNGQTTPAAGGKEGSKAVRRSTCSSPGGGPSIGRQPTAGAYAEADKHYLKESAVLTIAMREKRAPDTAPVPLRRDAGARRSRSVGRRASGAGGVNRRSDRQQRSALTLPSVA